LTHGANALALHEQSIEMRAPAVSAAAPAAMSKSELFKQRATEAKLRGYEGVACTECYNFTMVRNGTCLKCDTCGSTSGCS
jgi:ribonucleoside-diphosphate reductase alpha chain